MINECELLENCGFFNKFRSVSDRVCQELIECYCIGSGKYNCKRRKFREENGTPPPDEMMPNGNRIMISP